MAEGAQRDSAGRGGAGHASSRGEGSATDLTNPLISADRVTRSSERRAGTANADRGLGGGSGEGGEGRGEGERGRGREKARGAFT